MVSVTKKVIATQQKSGRIPLNVFVCREQKFLFLKPSFGLINYVGQIWSQDEENIYNQTENMK